MRVFVLSVQACRRVRGIEDPPPPSEKRSFIPRPILETMSSGWHPAKQCRSSLPSSALRLRLGVLRSSWAGQKDIAFSPLRVATSNLSNTSSKSASILGVSFKWAGRPDKRPAASFLSLQRNLNQISLRPLGILLRVGGRGLALPGRLDLHNLVLLVTLSVLGCLKHHDALATDEVFWTPP